MKTLKGSTLMTVKKLVVTIAKVLLGAVIYYTAFIPGQPRRGRDGDVSAAATGRQRCPDLGPVSMDRRSGGLYVGQGGQS